MVTPGVIVPAEAVIVQVEPSVQVCPLTLVEGLSRSALVTSPVAVKLLVTVKVDSEGEASKTTLPAPVVPVLTTAPMVGVVSVMFVAERPLGSVVESDGPPPADVTKTALATGVTAVIAVEVLPKSKPVKGRISDVPVAALMFGLALVLTLICKYFGFVETISELCYRIVSRHGCQNLGFILFSHDFFLITY